MDNTAHSDFFVFFVRLINTLTYLLTYLLLGLISQDPVAPDHMIKRAAMVFRV